MAASFFDANYYSQKEVENLVTLITPFTPNLSPDPALAAAIIATDNQAMANTEYVERPEFAETLASAITVASAAEQTSSAQRNTIVNYSVSDGDTLSGIASKYGLAIKTLADINNLNSIHQIKPGQTLTIPPADGVIYTVSKGDTLSGVVKKYQGNLAQTVKYNSENIQPGQKIVIVGGKTLAPVAPANNRLASSRNVVTRSSTAGRTLGAGGNRSNGYPWGWCTWYAAYRRNIPTHWGNAKSWLSSARSAGFATGSEPRAGAIVVTGESWYGHVAYVESVSGDSFTVSEMNYQGWGVVSRRTVNRGVARGFIY